MHIYSTFPGHACDIDEEFLDKHVLFRPNLIILQLAEGFRVSSCGYCFFRNWLRITDSILQQKRAEGVGEAWLKKTRRACSTSGGAMAASFTASCLNCGCRSLPPPDIDRNGEDARAFQKRRNCISSHSLFTITPHSTQPLLHDITVGNEG